MSCTVCPTDTKCLHTKRSTVNSIFTNGKMKKPPEDDEVVAPCESSSGDASADRPPGFMKYLKRCFKLHFRGNSSKKYKSKTAKANELVETASPVAEVKCVNSPVDPVFIPSDPVAISSVPNNPPDPMTSSQNPKSSTSNPVTSRPSLVTFSTTFIESSPVIHPSNVESSKPSHFGTINTANNTQKSLAVELLNLSKYGWYWGPITQAEAVEKLLDQPDGSFLVRDSYADHFLVSMSFKTLGKIYHTRINHSNGHFFFYTSPEHSCASIPELIEVSMDSSKSSIFCYSRPSSPFSPSLPIRLTRPVSRFTEVRSLQHLCRFVIRQYTRIDQIKDLPLPNSLCGYLQGKQF